VRISIQIDNSHLTTPIEHFPDANVSWNLNDAIVVIRWNDCSDDSYPNQSHYDISFSITQRILAGYTGHIKPFMQSKIMIEPRSENLSNSNSIIVESNSSASQANSALESWSKSWPEISLDEFQDLLSMQSMSDTFQFNTSDQRQSISDEFLPLSALHADPVVQNWSIYWPEISTAEYEAMSFQPMAEQLMPDI